MKRKAYLIALLYLVFGVSGSLYSIGEKTIRLGGNSIWRMLDYRAGITELPQVRPELVLALASERNSSPVYGLDLALSFDEGNPAHFRDSANHYRVIVSPSLAVADRRYARAGSGAALFQETLPGGRPERATGSGPLVVEMASSSALFAPNNRFYDFSLEFWLNPLNMENGEQILMWTSVRPSSNNASQRIMCVSSRNRLQWSFANFFYSPDGRNSIPINIEGHSPVVPKTWSHHLIRFDSHTGMVEYLVNGKTESIEYATSTRREGGEVFTPIAGEGGAFTLGGSFLGLLDEFRIHGAHIPNPAVRKYPLNGGRIETRAVDLGEGSNGILKVEASGGRLSIRDARINNEFRRNGRFRFSDDSEMQFFIRSSNNPYQWDNDWQPVIPGTELSGSVQGRYAQLAVDFYPSANGETSPYLEEVSIIYQPDEPPLPPAQLTAVAMDGAVQLRWKSSPDLDTQGYLVYYGTSSDDYFGEDSALGISPINVGMQTAAYIDGLKNGTLYYFRVAAYKNPSTVAPLHIGEFSREVRARPLR
ncbi:MAG: hypothetical protein LBI06_02350 [Treponema sp.]|jgi:hypothetical protein|nr:hypothetical protein [Treponema sp.]